jgi:biopolymer transport protein ExbD
MRLDRSRQKIVAKVPTASMADIAFLLIIFFMLTTSFSPVRTTVDLPGSEVRTEVEQNAAIVAITVENDIVFSDGDSPGVELNSPEDLGFYVRELIELFPNKQFVIRADRQVRYEVIDRVLDQLRREGAKNIGLLTEQRPPRS